MIPPRHWNLCLPREIVSGNVLAYGHFRARMKDRDSWIAHLKVQRSLLAGGIPDAAMPRTVHITSKRHGILDDDNLSGGAKHLRDALSRTRLIYDDNRLWVRVVYHQDLIPRKDPCHTLILITEGIEA